jgi:hypothetical protein
MSHLAPPHRSSPPPTPRSSFSSAGHSCASPACVTASFRTGPHPATAVQAIAALEELLAMLAARTGTAGQVARENAQSGSCSACRDGEDFARSPADGLIAGASGPPMMRLQTAG